MAISVLWSLHTLLILILRVYLVLISKLSNFFISEGAKKEEICSSRVLCSTGTLPPRGVVGYSYKERTENSFTEEFVELCNDTTVKITKLNFMNR